MTRAAATGSAAGYVPTSVRAMARAMLDWQDDDRRRAARPVSSRSSTRAPKRKAPR